MSIRVSGGRLARVTRDLGENWQQTREQWRDAKCSEFENTYINPLLHSVSGAVTVIEELDRILNKIRAECE